MSNTVSHGTQLTTQDAENSVNQMGQDIPYSYSLLIICERNQIPIFINVFIKYDIKIIHQINSALNRIVLTIKNKIQEIKDKIQNYVEVISNQLHEEEMNAGITDENDDYEFYKSIPPDMPIKFVIISDMHGNMMALQIAEYLAELSNPDSDIKLINIYRKK